MKSSSLAAFLVRNRVLLFIAAMLLTLATGYGMQFLKFDTSYKVFFRDDDPQLVAHEGMEDTYTKSDSVAFTFGLRDDVEGDLFTRERLATIEKMSKDLWQFPHAIRVDSFANFQYSEANGFDLKVYPLFEGVAELGDAEIQRRKKLALAEHTLVGALLAKDGRAATINTRVLIPEGFEESQAAEKEVVAEAFRLRDKLRAKHPEFEVHLNGVPIVSWQFGNSTEQDMKTLVPLMFLAVLILSGLLLRSIIATVSVLAMVVVTIPATLGSVGWAGMALNQISATAPMIIFTLCVCDAIHVLVSHIQLQRGGMTRDEARLAALEINMQPVLLTSVTTAIGFLSLNFSDSPAFREWGNVVAAGVMYAWLFTLLLLPLMMGFISAKPRVTAGQSNFFDQLADSVLRHQKLFFWGGIIFAVIATLGAPRSELTDSTYQYFDPGVPLRDAAEFQERRLTGFDNVSFSLPAGEADGVSDIEYLDKVEAFASWVRQQPYVAHVTTYTDVIKRINRSLNEDDPGFYAIPEERPLAVEAHMMYEMSLPFGMDLNTQVNFDKSATRFDVLLEGVKAKQIVEFEQNARRWLNENAPELSAAGSSVSVMFAHIGQNNIRSMLLGSAVAILCISLTMILALRSWRLGLLSLIPNTLPALIAFGLWGYFVGEVNLAVAAVFSISLGIVVDDSVHFLSKYLRARREQAKSVDDAIRYAFNTVGSALLVTTTALTTGFGILAFSNFQVNALTGLLTAIIIVLALVYDLLFLPALLKRTDSWLKL